jgi:hypothetical protein
VFLTIILRTLARGPRPYYVARPITSGMSTARFLQEKHVRIPPLTLCVPRALIVIDSLFPKEYSAITASVHHYQAAVWSLCNYHQPLHSAGRSAAVDTASRIRSTAQ